MKILRWMAMVVAAFGVAGAQANSVDLSGPPSALGFANQKGGAQYELNYQPLDAGDGIKLPFRYTFNSSLGEGIGGMGWDVPLLTAQARMLPDFGSFEVRLICGKRLYFHFPAMGGGNPVTFWLINTTTYSSDGQWRADVTGLPTIPNQSAPYNYAITITRWDGWKLYYPNNGLLQTVTTDTGVVIRWNRTGSGPVTSITIPAIGQTLLSAFYDSSTNLNKVTVNGDDYKPQTNSNGQLEQVERPDGTKDTFTYTNFSSANLSSYSNTSNPGAGNASVEHTSRYGTKLKLSWEPVKHFITSDGAWNYTVTAPHEFLVSNGRFGTPNVKRTRIATGEWEEIAFSGDRNGTRVIRGIDGSQTRVTEVRGDGATYGKASKVERLVGGTWVQTYLAAYNSTTGRLIRETDANNKDTVYTYTDHSTGLPHPVAGWAASVNSAPPKTETVTDATGRQWTYEYDVRGNLVKAADGAGVTRSYEYDARDRRTKVKDDAGTTIAQYAYNNNNRPISYKDAAANETTFQYLDRYGRSYLTKVTSPSGLTVDFTYDAKGNRTSAKGPNGETWTLTPNADNLLGSVVDPLAATTQFGYDARKNLNSVKNAVFAETKTEYDDLDLPKKLTDTLNFDALFVNNGNGATTKITDNRAKIYDLEYQRKFQRTKLKFPGGAQNVSTYDLNGRLSAYVGRGSSTINFTRDNAGRVTAKSWSYSGLSGSSSYTYDSAGRVTSASTTNPGGNIAQSYAYDADGRVSSVTSSSRTAQLAYDANGRLDTLTYPVGFAIQYIYDSDGRIDQIKKGTTVLADYAYNVKGQLESRTDGNGVVTTYTYDKLDRPTAIVVKLGLTVLWSAAYGYDLLGNRTYSQYASGNGDAYAYDALGQLTGVKYNGATPAAGFSGISSPTNTEATTYDAAGNRATHSYQSTALTYTVNDLNQYTAINPGGSPNVPSYNSRGDVETFNGQTFSYDSYGHLIRAATGSGTVDYLYDAFGNRAAITRSWGTTAWLYVRGNAIERYLGNTANGYRSFVYAPGIDNLLAEVTDTVGPDNGMVRYFYRDVLGNVVLQLNDSGGIVRLNSYDAWGNVTAISGGASVAPSEEFYFNGRSYDIETNLYHYRTRAYSAQLGRFLQADTIDFDGGDLNLYRYCSNDPVNFVDPLGLAPISGPVMPGRGFGHWENDPIGMMCKWVPDNGSPGGRGGGSGGGSGSPIPPEPGSTDGYGSGRFDVQWKEPLFDFGWEDGLSLAMGVPASEKMAVDMAKKIGKDLGPAARRLFHDLKEGADRTVTELKEHAREVYEAEGRQPPRWMQ